MAKKILVIGVLPPPLHGMSLATQAVIERIEKAGLEHKVFNIAGELRKSRKSVVLRLMRHIQLWKYLILVNSGELGAAYLTISGGFGQIYDVVTLALLRGRDVSIFIHHHSFSYLNSTRWLTKMVCWLSGKDATHIVLARAMALALEKNYKVSQSKMAAISNVAFIERASADSASRSRLRTVGFLGNFLPGKGLDKVLLVAKEIKSRNLPILVVIAGPCVHSGIRSAVESAADSGRLKWLGPIYGAEKEAYLASVDALLFPTSYMHEAEPIVIWEALANAIPVIAYDRGCILDQVGPSGYVLPQTADFVRETLQILEEWHRDEAEYSDKSHRASTQYETERGSALDRWQALMGQFAVATGRG